MVNTETIGQASDLCGWFASAASAVKDAVTASGSHALVIPRDALQDLIAERCDVNFGESRRMKALPLAIRNRTTLTIAQYRLGNPSVIVIFDESKISLEQARRARPSNRYAEAVSAALA